MRFYEVTVETDDFLEEEGATKKNVKKQNVSRKTDTFLEEYEDRACICLVSAEKRVDIAVCIMNDEVEVNAPDGTYTLKVLDIWVK